MTLANAYPRKYRTVQTILSLPKGHGYCVREISEEGKRVGWAIFKFKTEKPLAIFESEQEADSVCWDMVMDLLGKKGTPAY